MSDTPRPSALTSLLTNAISAQQRADAIYDQPDPQAAFAALEIPQVFELLSEVGLQGSLELVELATPEQIQGCLDLAIWDGDKPVVEDAYPWLSALAEVSYEKLTETMEALDPELRSLFLQKHTQIFDLTLGEEPEVEDDIELYFTPDRFLAVALRGSEDQNRLLRKIMEDLYRGDADLARHVLMSARSEGQSELEEMSYRWRTGRMADMGFVDYYEALELFRPLEPAEFTRRHAPTPSSRKQVDAAAGTLPLAVRHSLPPNLYLSRALNALLTQSPNLQAHIEAALALLTNKVLSAARAKPGDNDAVSKGALYAFSTVSLGLEEVSSGNLDKACEILALASMTDLHRVGFTVTRRISRVARAYILFAKYADQATRDIVGAMAGPRPWLPLAIAPDAAKPGMSGIRPFASRNDVVAALSTLAEVGTRYAIASAGRVGAIDALWDKRIPTAIARMLSGGIFVPSPLTQQELARAIAALQDGDKLPSYMAKAMHACLVLLQQSGTPSAEVHVKAAVQRYFHLLVDELAPLQVTTAGANAANRTIDARFVSTVLLETT